MRLFEYEGKKILSKNGIKIPSGKVVRTVDEAVAFAEEQAKPVVLKSQILSGGRGKAGGIKKAANPEQVRELATQLLDSTLMGEKMTMLLVEEQVELSSELYLGITLDSNSAQPVIMVSTAGGMDVEEAAQKYPEKIARSQIDVNEGLHPYLARDLAREVGLKGKVMISLGMVGHALYQAFEQLDAVVTEINPLGVTGDNELVALDAKFDLDEFALYRHSDLTLENRVLGETEIDKEARKLDLNYVELDGDIGIAGNGAGLMMATVDVIERLGGKAANFCDAGGARARPGSGEGAIEWWSKVVELVLKKPEVKLFLFNLHGGNHRGDEVATGLLRGLGKSRHVPMVVRLSGTREEYGRKILQEHGISSYDSLEEAAQSAVKLAKEVIK